MNKKWGAMKLPLYVLFILHLSLHIKSTYLFSLIEVDLKRTATPQGRSMEMKAGLLGFRFKTWQIEQSKFFISILQAFPFLPFLPFPSLSTHFSPLMILIM